MDSRVKHGNDTFFSGLGNLSGLFSRRLNIQHRFVYEVYSEKIIDESIEYQGTVKIIRMWSHYDNVR